MQTLREYIQVVEEKEKNLSEIRMMLRQFEVATGIDFVGDNDEIKATAWVFVALNFAIVLYLVKSLLVDPAYSLAGVLNSASR